MNDSKNTPPLTLDIDIFPKLNRPKIMGHSNKRKVKSEYVIRTLVNAVGGWHMINDFCTEDAVADFVECIKEFIDLKWDWLLGFSLTLSEDYRKFKKNNKFIYGSHILISRYEAGNITWLIKYRVPYKNHEGDWVYGIETFEKFNSKEDALKVIKTIHSKWVKNVLIKLEKYRY